MEQSLERVERKIIANSPQKKKSFSNEDEIKIFERDINLENSSPANHSVAFSLCLLL